MMDMARINTLVARGREAIEQNRNLVDERQHFDATLAILREEYEAKLAKVSEQHKAQDMERQVAIAAERRARESVVFVEAELTKYQNWYRAMSDENTALKVELAALKKMLPAAPAIPPDEPTVGPPKPVPTRRR